MFARDRRLSDDEVEAIRYGILQALTWGGIYAFINLKLFDPGEVSALFLAIAFILIWILPPIGLRLALQARDHFLLGVNLAMALCTIATTRLYFGWELSPVNLVAFGLVLIVGVIAMRRWGSSSAMGQRYGLTAHQLLDRDRRMVDVAANISAALHRGPTADAPETRPTLGGGRSGGAGASAEF